MYLVKKLLMNHGKKCMENKMSVDKNLYDLEKGKNEVYLSPHKWSSTERRLLQVRYKDQKYLDRLFLH